MKLNFHAGIEKRILSIVATVFILAVMCREVYSQEHTALLLRQTPPQGGKVTPAVGLHHFHIHSDVVLTAVPKPGWRFVYWLGDVTDSTANSTVAFVDTPKIIIAVFERDEYEFEAFDIIPRSTPVGGIYPSPGDYSRHTGGGGGGKKPDPDPKPNPEPEPDKDVPVPIPEPGTAVLLSTGIWLARRLKRK